MSGDSPKLVSHSLVRCPHGYRPRLVMNKLHPVQLPVIMSHRFVIVLWLDAWFAVPPELDEDAGWPDELVMYACSPLYPSVTQSPNPGI